VISATQSTRRLYMKNSWKFRLYDKLVTPAVSLQDLPSKLTTNFKDSPQSFGTEVRIRLTCHVLV